jgi:hypothetical protein
MGVGLEAAAAAAAAQGAESRLAEMTQLVTKEQRQKALLAEQLREIEADQATINCALV